MWGGYLCGLKLETQSKRESMRPQSFNPSTYDIYRYIYIYLYNNPSYSRILIGSCL